MRTLESIEMLLILILDHIPPFMLLLAVHDPSQPGLNLCGVSGAVGSGFKHVHVDVAVADCFDGSNEVLYS